MTESKRRSRREFSKKRATELLRRGQVNEARNFITQSIDVTHKMALEVIKECRKIGVDCVVAPYEADAQMAYFCIMKMAQVVITEDSDLIVFGCDKVFLKLDLQGCGVLISSDKINICMKLHPNVYSFEKFRHMCILSGCDYLQNLHGIGLKRALKFILMTTNSCICEVSILFYGIIVILQYGY